MRDVTLIIVGLQSDPHVEFFKIALSEFKVKVLDYNQFPKVTTSEDRFYFNDEAYLWNEIAILWRPNLLTIGSLGKFFDTDQEKDYWLDQWNELLNYIMYKVPIERNINHRGISSIASSKLYLPEIGKMFGIRTLNQVVSNDIEVLKSFQSTSDIVYKRLGSFLANSNKPHYTIPIEVPIESFKRQISIAPNLIQERCYGDYEVRMLVIGGQAFEIRIKSDDYEIDWRKLQNQQKIFEYYKSPSDTKEKCIDICAGLGLHMAAIDIIVDDNKQPYILDINPYGQFLFIDALPLDEVSSAVREMVASVCHFGS